MSPEFPALNALADGHKADTAELQREAVRALALIDRLRDVAGYPRHPSNRPIPIVYDHDSAEENY